MSATRVDPALGVGDATAGVAANDMADRIGLADRGQELVAEPLALSRAGNEARDVMELDRLGDHLARTDDLGDPLEAPSATATMATFGSIVVKA